MPFRRVPEAMAAAPSAGAVLQAAIWLGALALAALVIFRALGHAPPVPVGDPYLAESLYHDRYKNS